MRSEQEILALILDTARSDDRIRAVIMNGSRANPDCQRDPFQDFDIVYLVTDVAPFRCDPSWIDRFGERMILQTPDGMGPSASPRPLGWTWLMQFTDGNRIDLRLFPVANLGELRLDSLSLLLLEKDGVVGPLPPPGEKDYLPKPPTAKEFSDCCNEFWWVCPYVAKGLWRGQIVYARQMLDGVLRNQLLNMLTWHVGFQTDFGCNLGAHGKFLMKHLDPEGCEQLRRTYADAREASTWEALIVMGDLFRVAAVAVARRAGFEYPRLDDEKVSSHLRHVRNLPRDAKEIHPV